MGLKNGKAGKSLATKEVMSEGASETEQLALQLDYLFQLGVSFADRTISILGEITPNTFAIVDSALMEMAAGDSEIPVTIKVNSPGGDVAAMSSIISAMRMFTKSTGTPINTVGMGEVCSAAFFLLAAGTGSRYITQECSAMAHELSYGAGGKHSENKAFADQIENLSLYWATWMSERTNATIEFWQKTGKHVDHYFTPQELHELGVVHEVI